jgi:hypothetical protein
MQMVGSALGHSNALRDLFDGAQPGELTAHEEPIGGHPGVVLDPHPEVQGVDARQILEAPGEHVVGVRRQVPAPEVARIPGARVVEVHHGEDHVVRRAPRVDRRKVAGGEAPRRPAEPRRRIPDTDLLFGEPQRLAAGRAALRHDLQGGQARRDRRSEIHRRNDLHPRRRRRRRHDLARRLGGRIGRRRRAPLGRSFFSRRGLFATTAQRERKHHTDRERRSHGRTMPALRRRGEPETPDQVRDDTLPRDPRGSRRPSAARVHSPRGALPSTFLPSPSSLGSATAGRASPRDRRTGSALKVASERLRGGETNFDVIVRRDAPDAPSAEQVEAYRAFVEGGESDVMRVLDAVLAHYRVLRARWLARQPTLELPVAERAEDLVQLTQLSTLYVHPTVSEGAGPPGDRPSRRLGPGARRGCAPARRSHRPRRQPRRRDVRAHAHAPESSWREEGQAAHQEARQPSGEEGQAARGEEGQAVHQEARCEEDRYEEARCEEARGEEDREGRPRRATRPSKKR